MENNLPPSPQLPSRLNKRTERITIDGQPLNYIVIAEEVFLAQSNPRKAFALHKLRFDDNSEEIRICYYMIAEKPRMRGKWAYGQYAPMMTPDEARLIFSKLSEAKWI